jgi:hypothetical protein
MSTTPPSSFLPDWHLRLGQSWNALDPATAQAFETAFRSTARTVDIAVSVLGGHKKTAEFHVDAMTWSDMPLRRDAFSNNPDPAVTIYEYWDDTCWVEYSDFNRQHLQDCTTYSRDATTLFIGSDAYTIDLAGLVQINGASGKPRPIKKAGSPVVISLDADPIAMDDDDSVPNEFKCPILHAPMAVPVVAADGHTYGIDAIGKWLVFSSKSPVTNKPLAHTHLAVNHTLRKIMLEWIEAHQPHNVSVATGKAIGKKKKMRLNRVLAGKKRVEDEHE